MEKYWGVGGECKKKNREKSVNIPVSLMEKKNLLYIFSDSRFSSKRQFHMCLRTVIKAKMLSWDPFGLWVFLSGSDGKLKLSTFTIIQGLRRG